MCPRREPTFAWPIESSVIGFAFPLNIGTSESFSYGYNARGVASTSGLGLSIAQAARIKEGGVRQPSEMIAIGDSDGNRVRDAEISFVRAVSSRIPLLPPGDLHSSGANIAFCDGHIEWAKQLKWLELSDSAARRWNNDNLPHRELWFGR